VTNHPVNEWGIAQLCASDILEPCSLDPKFS